MPDVVLLFLHVVSITESSICIIMIIIRIDLK